MLGGSRDQGGGGSSDSELIRTGLYVTTSAILTANKHLMVYYEACAVSNIPILIWLTRNTPFLQNNERESV